jgi:hypothetical protein
MAFALTGYEPVRVETQIPSPSELVPGNKDAHTLSQSRRLPRVLPRSTLTDLGDCGTRESPE